MLIFCRCLNVSCEVYTESEDEDLLIDEVNFKPPDNLNLPKDVGAGDDPFFASYGLNLVEVLSKHENLIRQTIPLSVRKRTVGEWKVEKCILCDTEVFATNANSPSQLLISRSLLKQQRSLRDLRKSQNLSSIFQVVLPKLNENVMDKAVDQNSAAVISSNMTDEAVRSIEGVVAQYVKREQQKVEDRIQKFADEQHAAFEKFKLKAKVERDSLLRFLSNQYGGGLFVLDEEVDSALPLSPISLNSDLGTSPTSDKARRVNLAQNNIFSQRDDATQVLRPKAHSNPSSLMCTKRKRHSGGSTKTPSLSSHVEEQQDVFSLDEHENADDGSLFQGDVAVDADIDTDDSGTGEDYFKYYPPPPRAPAEIVTSDRPRSTKTVDEKAASQFGTSCPVQIPAAATALMFRLPSEEKAENDDDEDSSPKDVAASMQALARSIQAVDDPERLFGERPRRRWKTGEMIKGGQQCVVAGQRPKPF